MARRNYRPASSGCGCTINWTTTTFESPRLFEILGELDPDRVRDALVRIVERHEPLRTTISNDDGTPRARLRAVEPLPWVVHDWTTTPPERRESSARELCARDATRPFQLDADLMLRASLHKLDERRWWLLVTMHHIANDGWSAEVLREELQILLDGGTLPELPARYLDFVQWQNETISGDRFERGRDYWRTQLADLPRLELPIEFARPAITDASRARGVGIAAQGDDARAARARPPGPGDAVHDAAGRLVGAAQPLLGLRRHSHRHAESRAADASSLNASSASS